MLTFLYDSTSNDLYPILMYEFFAPTKQCFYASWCPTIQLNPDILQHRLTTDYQTPQDFSYFRC